MAATDIKLLLLLLAAWQVSAQGPTVCNDYITHPGVDVNELRDYDARTFCECQLQCSYMAYCAAFAWSYVRGQCRHRYVFAGFETRPNPEVTFYLKVCYPLLTPPPYLTIPPSYPPYFGGTPPPYTNPVFCRPTLPPFTRPITTETTPRLTVSPPFFTTTPDACPPPKGVGTGLVVLIAVFTAVGGIILGMLLAVRCCPKGGGRFGSSHPSSCKCTTCSPSCKSCHVQGCNACHQPNHPHVMHVTPGPVYPSNNMQAGQTYAVPANGFNGTYSVNIPRNY